MYQRPEQSRATVPRKKKGAWPKALPVRLSAVLYKAVPKCRQGRSPKKGLPSLAMGRARILTNFAMKIRQKFVKNLTNEFVIRHF